MTRGRVEIVSTAELTARARELSQIPADEGHDLREQTALVVWQLAGEYFGAAVHLVREVIADPVVTALPMAPPIVAGVINVRGDILTVVNLDRALDLPESQRASRFAIVVHDHDIRAAMLVDQVDGVEWFTAQREPVIATVAAEHARFLGGAYRSGTRMVTEINVTAVLAHPQLQPPGDGPA